MTRPPCALPRRLRSYPQGARIVGHPLRLSVHRPDKATVAVLPALVLEERRRRQLFRLGKPHHRRELARLKPTRHRGVKKPVSSTRGSAPRRRQDGETSSIGSQVSGPTNFSCCAFEQGAYVRDTFNRLSGKVSVEWGDILCRGCRPFHFCGGNSIGYFAGDPSSQWLNYSVSENELGTGTRAYPQIYAHGCHACACQHRLARGIASTPDRGRKPTRRQSRQPAARADDPRRAR